MEKIAKVWQGISTPESNPRSSKWEAAKEVQSTTVPDLGQRKGIISGASIIAAQSGREHLHVPQVWGSDRRKESSCNPRHARLSPGNIPGRMPGLRLKNLIWKDRVKKGCPQSNLDCMGGGLVRWGRPWSIKEPNWQRQE